MRRESSLFLTLFLLIQNGIAFQKISIEGWIQQSGPLEVSLHTTTTDRKGQLSISQKKEK